LSLDAISLGQALAIFAAGAGLLALVVVELGFGPRRRQAEAAHKRMQALAPRRTGGAEGSDGIIRRGADMRLPSGLPFFGNVVHRLNTAGFSVSPRGFVIGCLALAALSGGFASLILSPLMGLPIGFAAGIVLPNAVVGARVKKRTAALVDQLPDALDLMMRGLRVGHPVSVTIGNVARTMPDPIGAEFRKVAEQVAHGDYLTAAFADLAARVQLEDMDYLSASLTVHYGTGGNLADMLGTLSKVIRDRITMRRRIRAISSEGRMSALILSALPVLIYMTTKVTAPSYYGGVSDDPLLMPIAVVIVGLVVGNGIALSKLSNFRI